MANKDLTSLKVYGNDDPAGSVYKVSGGSGGGNLILTTATETVEGEEITYLTHTDGSIVTWQEIYDALASGVGVAHIEAGETPGGKQSTAYRAQQSRIVLAESNMDYVVYEEPNILSGTFTPNIYAAASATNAALYSQDND